MFDIGSYSILFTAKPQRIALKFAPCSRSSRSAIGESRKFAPVTSNVRNALMNGHIASAPTRGENERHSDGQKGDAREGAAPQFHRYGFIISGSTLWPASCAR
jgi:hypothetical protein